MKLQRIEIHKIKKENEYYPFFLDLCIKANNLYNHGNYLIRQKFIETTKLKEQGLLKHAEWIRYNELDKLLKKINNSLIIMLYRKPYWLNRF